MQCSLYISPAAVILSTLRTPMCKLKKHIWHFNLRDSWFCAESYCSAEKKKALRIYFGKVSLGLLSTEESTEEVGTS